MQEEIEHKTVNLAISTTKLSARTQKPMSANRVSSELAQNERLYNVEATNNVHAGGKRVRGFVGIEVVNPLPY